MDWWITVVNPRQRYLEQLTETVQLLVAQLALREIITLADEVPTLSDDQLRIRLVDLATAARGDRVASRRQQHADSTTQGVCWYFRWGRSGIRRPAPRVRSANMTGPIAEGERVVLARRDNFNPMVPFRWSAEAPPGLNDLEWAEELGAKWEGDELVTYDYPTFIDLLEYYEKNEYLPDND